LKIPLQLKYSLGLLLATPFLPILYLHGKKVKKQLVQLPGAKNPHGKNGQNYSKGFKVLFLGESTMAGVGVPTHAEGFPGALCQTLSENLKQTIEWEVIAKSGYNVRACIGLIKNLPSLEIFQLLIIGLGANDAFQLNSPNRWKRDMSLLIKTIRQKGFHGSIVFTPMPPIQSFPAFTRLMKAIPGKLVTWLGEALSEQLKIEGQCYYHNENNMLESWLKAMDAPNTEAFFSDGIHPSGMAYRLWGKETAHFLLHHPEILSLHK